MENDNFIEKLASQFGQNATVKSVFGEPVTAGDKTIIPVAKIAYGLGGGHGQGMKKSMRSQTADAALSDMPPTEGTGGGGGLYATPKGVYEITSTGTRFIPAHTAKPLLIGLAVGMLARGFFHARRRHR